ncbi:MAG: nucleoside monophosphate kinase [Candidatus Aenigmarchaeota archaeon]|nr:nucleoside monophosphate kinase [Candidatus Aenigmarchaeota archaeon]
MTELIIFGPPGSGKGTYSKELERLIGIKRISTGDIFRKEIEKNTKLGQAIKKYVESGALVPDDIVIKVVEKELKRIRKKNFILDGFPRTIEQAKALDKIVKIKGIILLRMDERILIKKLAGRRVCINCGKPYNVVSIDEVVGKVHYVLPAIKPKKRGICDVCGSKLIQRKDDKPSVIKKRLEVYKKQSRPVLRYYRKKGVTFINVTVNRDIETVTKRILSLLKRRMKIKV